jgi:hypothetical protein
MVNFDLERFMNEPIYAWDFQFMIGDLEDFLDFSESNIEWQYRRELRSIHTRAEAGEFRAEEGYTLRQMPNTDSKSVSRCVCDTEW